MKPDERAFLILCQRLVGRPTTGTTPRVVIEQASGIVHPKRALYLLQKWSDKGWYSYGVTIDLGWMTELGMEQKGE
jgi:hypothetical protein